MPKEVIRLDGTTFAVEVGWGRDSFVQIGSVDQSREQYSPERGYFIDLDRQSINRLIRVLRRARDQAYGADE